MGWLRQLMLESPRPFRSFDGLARAALEHPDWPAESRPQIRSLAAIFSKLDRRLDLEWLAERPAAQRVLAEVLHAPARAVTDVLGERRAEADRNLARVRWHDLPEGRPLELRDEDLPPGIPREVQQPACWSPRPVWWIAPSGSGRTLTGSWLAARGEAVFVRARRWEAAAEALPRSGTAFVELATGPTTMTPLPRLPGRCCFAAPSAPPPGWAPHFDVIQSAAVPAFLDELVHWLVLRLPPDARVVPSAFVAWVTRSALPAGLARTLGDVVGLVGLADELTTQKLQEQAWPELLRAFVRARVERGLRQGDDVGWLASSGPTLLVSLAERSLADSDEPWHAARSLEAWMDLVPAELRRGGEVDWLRVSLAGVESAVRPRDIERAAERLPPGAYKFVSGLLRLELLREHTPGELRLGPSWLTEVVLRQARQELLRHAPLEWGEALLRDHAAPELQQLLLEQVRRDPGGLAERVLEGEVEEQAAEVAALEAVFRAWGIAAVLGHELPSEPLEWLWDEQMRLAFRLAGHAPRPRIEFPAAVQARAPLLGRGAFYLAALALSEHLPRRRGLADAALRPWNSAAPDPLLREIYDAIRELVLATSDQPATWRLPVFGLIDRLRSAIGSVALNGGGWHPLEAPGLVLDEIQHGVLTWDSLASLAEHPSELEALAWLAERREVPWSVVSESLWDAWLGTEPTRSGTALGVLEPRGSLRASFWRHLPQRGLLHALGAARGVGATPPYGLLSADHWDVLLAHDPTEDAAGEAPWALALEHVPEAAVQRALADDRLLAVALPQLWRAHPALLRRELEVRAASSPDRAVPLLTAAPREALAQLGALVESFPSDRLGDDELQQFRAWLHAALAERLASPGPLHAALSRIERQLFALRPRAT